MPRNGRRREVFGRNYHKGFTPGGFTQHFRKRSSLCSSLKKMRNASADEIKEAASIVLENRKMPRAEEAAANPPPKNETENPNS